MDPRSRHIGRRSHRPGRRLLAAALLVSSVLFVLSAVPAARADQPQPPTLGPTILLGWNDLGMHCSNKNFADLCVLPPYNTFWGVIIKRGDAVNPPQVLGPGYTVSYSFEDNTYSVGKTDFWTYAQQLFGVALPPNVGLTGKGMTGSLDLAASGHYFRAEGTPLTPYTDSDLVHEQPYQLGNLVARDGGGNVIATTQIVTPVSNEMMCSGCHIPQSGETVEHAILRRHDNEEQTHLVNSRPVLCANCHASNALGMPGMPGLPSLSLAMHEQHAEVTDNCYNCHPGPNTQCLRDVMSQQFGLTCQTCHGHVIDVANSIEQGRQPWLQEPRCETCHGANYAEMPNTLYRNSNNGHGGLYCETCHSSPHAILPSREERDNRQNLALQGHAGTLSDCTVCHGVVPAGPGPHGLSYPGAVGEEPSQVRLDVRMTPNPMASVAEIDYGVIDSSPVRLSIHDAAGREVRVLTAHSQTPGTHTLVWDGLDQDRRSLPAGVYFCRLENGGQSASARVIKVAR